MAERAEAVRAERGRIIRVIQNHSGLTSDEKRIVIEAIIDGERGDSNGQ